MSQCPLEFQKMDRLSSFVIKQIQSDKTLDNGGLFPTIQLYIMMNNKTD